MAHMHLLEHFCGNSAPSDGNCVTDGGNRMKDFNVNKGGFLNFKLVAVMDPNTFISP